MRRKSTKSFNTSRLLLLICAASMTMTACGSPQEDRLPGGVILQYASELNKNGFCQPERVDIADTQINGNELVAVRGESRFILDAGTTNIPFQSVHKYPDEEGFSDDTSITMLNHEAACEDLTIEVTIEYCEYYTDDGRAKLPCPPIVVKGSEGFKEIVLKRNDQPTQ